MSRTMRRRGAQILGSAAIFMLAVSGPATARPDETGPTPQGSSVNAQGSQRMNECHYLDKCPGANQSANPSPRPPRSFQPGFRRPRATARARVRPA